MNVLFLNQTTHLNFFVLFHSCGLSINSTVCPAPQPGPGHREGGRTWCAVEGLTDCCKDRLCLSGRQCWTGDRLQNPEPQNQRKQPSESETNLNSWSWCIQGPQSSWKSTVSSVIVNIASPSCHSAKTG